MSSSAAAPSQPRTHSLSLPSRTQSPALSTRPTRPSPPAPSIRSPLQILKYFGSISSALPVSGLASTGLAQDDYNVQVPFTDNADKGDLRFDYQIDPNSSAFLRISDRKEDGVNYPIDPDSARRSDQRQDPDPRPADRAGLHAPLRSRQGARCPHRPRPHQGRQVQPLHRQHSLQQHPRPAHRQRRSGRRSAVHQHHEA